MRRALIQIREELDIDVSDILFKIRCALFPVRVDKEALLASPDFWGPMAVVVLYGLILFGQVRPRYYCRCTVIVL